MSYKCLKQEQYLESLRQEAAGGSEQAFLGCYLGHFCLVKLGYQEEGMWQESKNQV